MEMISILQQFIRAEHVGDLNGNLNALEQDHPDVHKQFMMGNHTLRRSERFLGWHSDRPCHITGTNAVTEKHRRGNKRPCNVRDANGCMAEVVAC
ncbi:hypothetical protein MAR_004659 [Mya arenaria]|uniref:Uncharacterized protein n=1 Tax=Mya arenaria TaxID=6604 RepID=A0ABY7F1C5_MYAAR|nr:hypothetical protein MAR_004659 [Mya arenaria]